ncbi:MAG: hypothetical protein L6Q54_04170 [Leptospiraceae bacterium]|nr:hypothetical protein [Leptospiraceae bacterium]
MQTKVKKKTKILNIPKSKNKKKSSKGNLVSEYKQKSEKVLTDKEIDKLLGTK